MLKLSPDLGGLETMVVVLKVTLLFAPEVWLALCVFSERDS